MTREDSGTRGLYRALLANVASHGVAMGAMALLLMPMMPGGTTEDPALRMRLIAEETWRFRLGWLPWHLCALTDLWLGVAMVRARPLPRAPAWIVLILTLVAVVPDQLGQARWLSAGVALARQGDVAAYLAFERPAFELTAGWGALVYTAAAIGWTVCFQRAGLQSPAMRRVAWLTWPLMLVVTVATLTVTPTPLSARLISTGNGIGFTLMMLWLIGLTRAAKAAWRSEEAPPPAAPPPPGG